MKIWEKVNNLTGYDSKSRVLVEFLNQASKFLVASLPEKFLWSIASEETIQGKDADGSVVIGNGSGTAYDKIIAVYRFQGAKRRIASEVPDNSAYAFDEKDSILRASKMFPKYYRLADKIFIKPDPDYNAHASDALPYDDLFGTGITVAAGEGDKGIIIYASPPVIDANISEWVLVEFEHIALLYAASLDAKRKSDLANVEEDFEVATMYQAQSQDFYQRFTSEFQAASGSLNAPPPQQQTQRQEERAAT